MFSNMIGVVSTDKRSRGMITHVIYIIYIYGDADTPSFGKSMPKGNPNGLVVAFCWNVLLVLSEDNNRG